MAATTSLVTQITGQAWVRGADGSLTPIHQGMRVPIDADIVTATGASVQLQADGLPPLTIGENRDVQLSAETAQADVDPTTSAVAPPVDSDVTQVLAALNAGADPLAELDPTAAVLQGGSGGDGGSSFTRLVGIVETTNPLGLEYPRPGAVPTEDVRLGGTGGGDDADPLAAPSLEIADGNGIEAGQLTVAENASQSSAGSFAISAPAGLAFVTVGDTTLTAAQLGNIGNAPVTIQTPNGQITLIGFDAATGTVTYEYTVGGAQDHSAGDDSVVDTITVVITDGSGQQTADSIAVHITDTNPVVAGENGGELAEDNALVSELSGNVLDNDTVFDGPGSVSWSNPVNAEVLSRLEQFGTITLGADGKWTFNLDNTKPAVQALAEGQEIDFAISYTVADSDGDTVDATLTFKVIGTNDAPVITSGEEAAAGSVSEAGNADDGAVVPGVVSVTGTLASSDVDADATATWSVAGASTYGSIAIDPTTGKWTYTLDNAKSDTQALKEGETTSESFTATVTDEFGAVATQVITVTITGTNDVPKITSTDVDARGTVTEAGSADDGAVVPGTATISGTLTSSDVDADATATWSVAGASTYGSIAIDPTTGKWTYTLDNAKSDTQALKEGETTSESFTATVTDEFGAVATQVITVTITGTNDVPKITSTDVDAKGAVTEAGNADDGAVVDGVISATGTLTSSDVDADATATWSVAGASSYGSIVIDPSTGKWTYTLDNAKSDTQALKEGDSQTETFTATVTDDFGAVATQTITVTITGTNDAPTLTPDVELAAQTSVDAQTITPVNVSGQFIDADNGDVLTYTAIGLPAGLSIDPDTGIISGTLDNSASQGGEVGGAKGVYTITVTATDVSGASVSKDFTWNVSNPAPTAVADTGSVNEDATLTVTAANGVIQGAGKDTDPDGDTLTVTRVGAGATTTANAGSAVTGAYGTLTLHADGSYTYVANNANALAAGEKATDVFTYQVSDGEGGTSSTTLTMNLTGTNDVPLIVNSSAFLSVSEEGLPGNGNESYRDAGLPDTGGNPVDTTNSVSATGKLTITDIDSASWKVALTKPADGVLKSGGEDVNWTLSEDGHTLIGSADGKEVIQITINNQGEYGVKLLGPVDHPDATSEDILSSLYVGVVVTDSEGGKASTTIAIRIEDDAPVTHETAPEAVVGTDIPDVYVGQVSFVGSEGTLSKFSFGNGAVEVTGKGFKDGNGNDLTLVDADVNQTNYGLGVASGSAPDHQNELANEVDWRETSNGKGASEELTIRLTGGKVAYGATIDFEQMFGDEKESGVAVFYRNGVEIYRQTFSSDENGGDYAAHFKVDAGGFDTIVLLATDNGNNGPGDNSDFTVSGVTFLGSDDVQAIGYAEGTLQFGYGADSAGRLVLTGAEEGLKTSIGHGINIIVSDSGNLVQGFDKLTNALVFDVRLTPATGKWEFYQYQSMQDTADGVVDFKYQVTDADGDHTNGTFSVEGVEPPAPSITIDDMNSGATPGDVSVAEDNGGSSHGGSFTITADAGLKGITVDGTGNGKTTITAAQLNDLEHHPISVTTNKGTLTLNGYDPVTGKLSYSYEVSGPQHHTGDDTNVQDHFTVTVEDKSGATANDTLDVLITDTAPVLQHIIENAVMGSAGTNILLMLDSSGSMDESSGIKNKDRMDVLKEAVNKLLDQYGEFGDVRVLAVDFDGSARVLGGGWISLAEAKTLVAKLDRDGGTNYDSAIDKAMDAWGGTGKLVGDDVQNISYFFSDGEPVNGAINNSDQTEWESFLDANNVNSYAIGLGNDTSATNLDPIAYNPQDSAANNTILVTNLNQLDAVIQGTIVPPVTGDIAVSGNIGADVVGAYIAEISIGGQTYTYNTQSKTVSGGSGTYSFDRSTSELTVNTSHGKLTIDLAGDNLGHYEYKPEHAGTDTFSYKLQDGDGDVASSTITINVTAPAHIAPDAVADHVITNISDSQIVLSPGALLANDVAGSGALELGSTTVNTGSFRGGDFTSSKTQTITFNGTNEQYLELARDKFAKLSNEKAEIKIKGYLGEVTSSNNNDEDTIRVALIAGEVLKLGHNIGSNDVQLEYRLVGSGGYAKITDGGSFTASQSGAYEIRVINIKDPDNWFDWGQDRNEAESYALTMTVDYSKAEPSTSHDATGSYTIHTADGHQDTADITVSYQGGSQLIGTDQDEILLAGSGNDTLTGGKDNDVLIGGEGNDTLIGGEGDDIFRWESGDEGTTSNAAIDTVNDFGLGNGDAKGADTLDLSDLLIGEDAVGADLSKFLQLSSSADGKDTVINVNTHGGFNAAGTNFEQQIILKDVDLTDLPGHGNQNDLINNLIAQGKLNVDQQ